MRVLVCGGRDFVDRRTVYSELDAIHAATPISALMHGNARGADQLADDWAAGKVQTLTFLPLWEEQGRKAGPIRNQKMLDEGKPDLVVAFAGGRGTADMLARAKKAGVTIVYTYPHV